MSHVNERIKNPASIVEKDEPQYMNISEGLAEFSLDSYEEHQLMDISTAPSHNISSASHILNKPRDIPILHNAELTNTQESNSHPSPVLSTSSSGVPIQGITRKQMVSVNEDPLSAIMSPQHSDNMMRTYTLGHYSSSGAHPTYLASKTDTAASSVASIVSKTTSTLSSFASKFQDAVSTGISSANKHSNSHFILSPSVQSSVGNHSLKSDPIQHTPRSQVYGVSSATPTNVEASIQNDHQSAFQSNSLASQPFDDSKRRAIILSAIGQLLPGENVSMFITHIYDVKDTASAHTGVGLDGFGQDLDSNDIVWCCLLTFYRIAVFSFKESQFLDSFVSEPAHKISDMAKEWVDSGSVSKQFQYMMITQVKACGRKHHVLQMPISSVERVEKMTGLSQPSSNIYASPAASMGSSTVYNEYSSDILAKGTIIVFSKDNGRFIQFSTDSVSDFNKAFSAIQANAFPGRANLAYLYAFEARRSEVQSSTKVIDGVKRITSVATRRRYNPLEEFQRMIRTDEDVKCPWQPYLHANANYTMCPSYPAILFGPSSIDDNTSNGLTLIRQTAAFRSGGRMQTLVWASRFDGASIWRSSQPRVGFQGNRSTADELFIKNIGDCAALANANAAMKGRQLERPNRDFIRMLTGGNNDSDLMLESFTGREPMAFHEKCMVKIFDLRPKSSAVANRTQGYGYENTSYYRNTTLSFHGIGNIHAVRDSYQKLSALCNSLSCNDSQWLQLVEETKWLSSIRAILSASWQAAFHVRYNRLPVLLHCSHGWDRTSQVSAISQIFLDPFYRTRAGFSCLIEKEFLALGHPFRLRSGHGEGRGDKNVSTSSAQIDESQLSPIFIQFLDCVFQIVNQYPNHFEFNTNYLLVLSEHVYSCRFGTFLTDTEKERELFYSIRQRTNCIWPYLESRTELVNEYYKRSSLADEDHESKGALMMPLSSLLRNVTLWIDRHCMYSAKATSCCMSSGCMAEGSQDPFIRDTIQGEDLSTFRAHHIEKEVEHLKQIVEEKEKELQELRQLLKEKEFIDQNTTALNGNDAFNQVQDFVDDIENF